MIQVNCRQSHQAGLTLALGLARSLSPRPNTKIESELKRIEGVPLAQKRSACGIHPHGHTKLARFVGTWHDLLSFLRYQNHLCWYSDQITQLYSLGSRGYVFLLVGRDSSCELILSALDPSGIP